MHWSFTPLVLNTNGAVAPQRCSRSTAPLPAASYRSSCTVAMAGEQADAGRPAHECPDCTTCSRTRATFSAKTVTTVPSSALLWTVMLSTKASRSPVRYFFCCGTGALV